MSKIQIMDDVLSNKIAAGEVVEKVMNVVKELVENSIDANADEITIKLKESGIKEIEVIDNGEGMDPEDAKMAFQRHATSKLKNLDDLFYIESLGFRGEALPSIASVSKMRLKTSNGKEGSLITIAGGKDLKFSKSDLQQGTTITVSELFYNTPVRLKYLKNSYVELSYIIDYINKMALSYPNIKFCLMNNDKELLSTDGNGDLLKVIYKIFGADVTKKMIPISAENDDYLINGYISYPEVTKGNRGSITTLVNGRVIKNNELNKCIVDSYHTYIHKGRFPIIVLNIEVDPILVDINIHPTKMDIKFSKMDNLKKLVEDTISKRLEEINLIPEISVRDINSINEVDTKLLKDVKEDVEADDKYEEIKLSFDVYEEKQAYGKTLNKEVSENNELVLEEDNKTPKIKKMYPKGVVLNTYIIAENEDGMYLIDQHAAAERINYEKILKQMQDKPMIIDLLIPIKIELKKDEYIIVKERFNILEEYGFDVSDFGKNTIIVRSHPAWIIEEKAEEVIRRLVDIIAENGEFDYDKFIWRMVATAACRMSVMAGDYLSVEDQEWILENIRYCDNPFTCPHGRPSIITYTKYELEKLFKRQLD